MANPIKTFIDEWSSRGYEKGDTQIFWLTLFRDVFGIDKPERFLKFEVPVKINKSNCLIDALVPSTKVLIEQKSFGTDLTKPLIQSDGKYLTPFEQAKRYADELPYSQRPRWIVTCNFKELYIYDLTSFDNFQKIAATYFMESQRKFHFNDDIKRLINREPVIIKIERLERDYKRLNFLVDPNDENIKPEFLISAWAGEIIGGVHKALEDSYKISGVDNYDRSLNKLCVQLVFCLYAEDAGIFEKNQFYDYVKSFDLGQRLNAIMSLFKILNQPDEMRGADLNESNKLANRFPYVNGGLFAGEGIQTPTYNSNIDFYLISTAMQEFDWSNISPTIFGAMFESTLNPLTRRAGGMHYTSIENIHKVIDPLFMDELYDEFNRIKRGKSNKLQRLRDFQDKLASLTFLDPACGSGNFLTETYLSLRQLENEVIREINRGSGIILDNPVKVTINQFYGMEINDFAVAVAKTALWIAESQMLQETEMIIHRDLNFLPLKNYATIIEGNALKMDWNTIIDKSTLSYIIGNPPFVGYTYQTQTQKADLLAATQLNTKKIDYVVSWYYKAAQFIQNTNIRCAFVSTNSITQGEQVAIVWKPLIERFNIHIDFACRTFKWLSESKNMAAVHCVIIGFSCAKNRKPKLIYEDEQVYTAKNINAYLVDADNVFVESRSKPICDVPEMITGNRPADGGNLIIEAADYKDFIKREPNAKQFIKRLIGAEEFINRKDRYCLWLVNASPDDIKSMPLVAERVEACRQDRLKGAADRQKLAATPHLFREINNPKFSIVVPKVSSGERKYVPIGFIDDSIIASDLLFFLPNAKLYHFGILTSSIHMAWLNIIAGYLGTSYRYSIKIVYNNFVWCKATYEQHKRIEETALDILIARDKYPKASLADLYDEYKMPKNLRKAHQANDRAVLDAYGFDHSLTESEIVAELMKLYQQLTA